MGSESKIQTNLRLEVKGPHVVWTDWTSGPLGLGLIGMLVTSMILMESLKEILWGSLGWA
jgi:hypothetical protein